MTDNLQREIKFRAWDKETGKMHYVVNKPRTEENVDDELIIQFDCTGYSARTDKKYIGKECLMQFTCLLDKNGKEIYEGDIVKYPLDDSKDVIYEIIWNQSAFSLKENNYVTSFILNHEWEKRLKVIGNKFENPELLEAKND